MAASRSAPRRTSSAPSWGAKHRALSHARVRLSSEQRTAVDAMCSDTGWANLIGRAGTGKTTVLRTVVDALHDKHDHKMAADRARKHGHHTAGADHVDKHVHDDHGKAAADHVVVVSTSAMVARRSGDAIGADRSYSVEGFVEAVRRGALEPTERTWVIVEEAAMVDTPRMATLLTAAGPAVIRTVGDDRQLAPIGPGGWYAEQLARHPGTELTHVYRQRDPDDVRDFTDLGAGKVEEAVRSLDDRCRIIVLDELGQRAHAIVDLYLQERQRGRGAHDVGVVLDGSNHVLDDVNRRIQRERLVMEEIGGTPLEVEATDTDRRWLLYRGDHVVFRERVVTRDEKVIRNGERGEIVGIDHRTREVTSRARRRPPRPGGARGGGADPAGRPGVRPPRRRLPGRRAPRRHRLAEPPRDAEQRVHGGVAELNGPQPQQPDPGQVARDEARRRPVPMWLGRKSEDL